LKVKPEEVTARIENLLEELRVARNENSAVRAKAAVYKASVIASRAFLVGNSKQYRYISPYLLNYCTGSIGVWHSSGLEVWRPMVQSSNQ
jgi:hypothetical protein